MVPHKALRSFGLCTIRLINNHDYWNTILKSKSAIAIALSALMILGVTVASSRNAYAHTFYGDESASFLALVETIKVQLQLVRNDLATNAENALEHAEHAVEHLDADTIAEISERNERLGREVPASLTDLHETLESGNYTAAGVDDMVDNIYDLLDETVTVRIDNTQLTNSTVQGLVLANLVDETLEHYSGAYGIHEEHPEEDDHATSGTEDTHDEEGSVDMSNSTTPTEEELEELTTFELAELYPFYVNEESDTTIPPEGNHTTIVDTAAYDSARALAARSQVLFDTELKAMADANATQAVADLDAGLEELKQAIDDKAPLEDVDTIVHTKVHPNIQIAYNLQIIPEFPIPLLAALVGIGSVLAYSRFKATRRSIF